MIVPKIDYSLLGVALNHYAQMGYNYVEMPWVVDEETVRATFPEGDRFQLGVLSDDGTFKQAAEPSFLVGSAEQALMAHGLPQDRYMAVTPCFRLEPRPGLFYQYMFMKLELYDNREAATVDEVIHDALTVMGSHVNPNTLAVVETDIGRDIELAGIEIGSYGERTFHNQRYVYGTGLALPRFSITRALSSAI